MSVLAAPDSAKAAGATYYVDAVGGSDFNSGTNVGAAWKTLEKVNNVTFQPGDHIMFKSGAFGQDN